MKITKPFCIDDSLIKDLKKHNASELVNKLLIEYFEGFDSKNIAKLKQILIKKSREKAVLLKQIRELKRKIKENTEKEAKILRLSRKYPDRFFKILQGVNTIPHLLIVYRSDMTLKKYGWMEVKKIFLELKGGLLKK